MSGVWVREAQAEDAAAIAAIQIDAWQVAYAHLLPAGYLQGLSQHTEARMAYWREQLGADRLIWVAQWGPDVVGWAAAGPSQDPDAHILVGAVEAIYLSPLHWRLGIGTPLLRTALAKLLRQGFTEATLWVVQGNVRAQAFCQALGFVPQPGAAKPMARGGATLTEQRYWRSLKPITSPRPAP
ncbi:GNAT family N-acetyltransferase [Pseudomonas typographi]|uniref:GNAT family N-acetyltransferase n=1 Tax=Pseudomonas typographi TaxID=2715964 RepID=UPI0016882736|nr:GNAT family N-acetyltransferase [Pseudomonas typographi]MBD1551260.1 GNAT family N-acetyltransferase [Pseudomonas typographi]MBD1586247.1 GNAT family N-acetyltransferase [Pseudomonas typographi]